MDLDLINKGAKEIVSLAERAAQDFKNDRLKTNQIRNFYGAVTAMRTKFQMIAGKDIEKDEAEIIKTLDDIDWSLIMLKPKLAYAAGRQRPVRANFYPFMRDAIESVESIDTEDIEQKKKVLKKFFALIESVVGYHKFYGDS